MDLVMSSGPGTDVASGSSSRTDAFACFGSVGGVGSVSVAGVSVKVRSMVEDLLRERMGLGMVQSKTPGFPF